MSMGIAAQGSPRIYSRSRLGAEVRLGEQVGVAYSVGG